MEKIMEWIKAKLNIRSVVRLFCKCNRDKSILIECINTGVTVGYDFKPTISMKEKRRCDICGNIFYVDGLIYHRNAENYINCKYYINGIWPIDIKTGKKMSIAK